MKNKIYIVFIGVLIGSCGDVRSERSYMDTIKMGHIWGKRAYITNQTIEQIANTIKGVEGVNTDSLCLTEEAAFAEEVAKGIKRAGHVCAVPYFLYNGNKIRLYWKESKDTTDMHSDKMSSLKNLRHSAWYTYQAKSSFPLLNTIVSVVEPLVYPIIDSSVEAGVNRLNKFDFVKNVTKNIPVEHRPFIADNGKFVFAAGINRAWRVYVDQGPEGFNGENLKIFAKDASAQVGCSAAEEYVVKPTVKKIIGSDEDSISKDLLSAGLNIAAYCAINSLAGK